MGYFALAQCNHIMEVGGQRGRVTYGGRADRRRTARFPVREEVQYRMVHKSCQVVGAGKTLNMGSGGLLFTTEDELPVGRTVELSVNWPARLGGTCPLKFVAVGRVVRSEADIAAVRIERHEFRTRASGERVETGRAATV